MNKETIRKNPIFFAYIDPPKTHKTLNEAALSPLKKINTIKSDLKKPMSPKFKTQAQHKDAFSYSCFANNTNDKVFLTKHCLSGKFLDSSLNNKNNSVRLLNEKIAKTYDFDYVFDHIWAYFFSFEFKCIFLSEKPSYKILIQEICQEFLSGKELNVLFYGQKYFLDLFFFHQNSILNRI